jgi:hypothetical protein
MEYQWNVILKGDETAKTISVIDMEHINMSFLRGDPMVFVKKTIQAAGQHYPERCCFPRLINHSSQSRRSFVLIAVNAPSVVAKMWQLVKPLVHPNTQRKVRILSKKHTLQGLLEYIDISNIPDYYGGHAHVDPPPGEPLRPEAARDSCR